MGLESENLILHHELQLIPMKESDNTPSSDLVVNIAEAANFATYFTGSLAAQSTPHLYISSLVTWPQESTMSQGWKRQFSCAPSFKQTKGGGTVPLMIIQNQSPVRSVAFSNDGTRIVSGSHESVRVWDASTGAELTRLNGHTSSVRSVAFSSDGTHIISGSDDMSVRVWDALTGVQLTSLVGHTALVFSVAFSNDSTHIVSGSWDRSVQVWDALIGVELTSLISHTAPVNPTMVSHIVSSSDHKSVLTWDTVHHSRHWISTIDNWVVGLPNFEHLMWVHPQIKEVLYHPYNILIISSKGSAIVDFTHSKIGMEWAECHTPSLP